MDKITTQLVQTGGEAKLQRTNSFHIRNKIFYKNCEITICFINAFFFNSDNFLLIYQKRRNWSVTTANLREPLTRSLTGTFIWHWTFSNWLPSLRYRQRAHGACC